MEPSQRILVVDDDKAIVDLMRDFLESEGFQVEGAYNVAEARSILNRTSVSCLLLDVMMPGESGFDLCREVARESDIPILFLSARDGDVDKIRGLGLGGDDYIVKTATPAEVVARVKAVLRRYGKSRTDGETTLTYGRLQLDVGARVVKVENRPVQLTPREFDLLCLLAENPHQVFTYDQLLERYWKDVGDRHTITVHMARIREKIEEDPANPQLILNVWGVGYRFEGQR